MAAPALGLLLHAARSAGPAVSTIIAASVCAALAGRVVFSWAAISLVPVLLCSGWLVWRNGYPLSPGWRGLLPGRSRARDPAAGAYARLAATEGALLSQNRREAGGFLALGAAHEFRGALSRIRLVATHGLSLQEAVDKDAGLRLILDHASHAESAAVDLLDRISSDFPESPVEMAAARDLEDVVRMARASCRAQGVVLRVDLQAGVVFTARRNDVELILLNLVQNAVQAVSRSVCLVPPEICFSAVTKEEMAILEVRDQAGGVPADRAHLLFMPGASGSGSSGIGLYISRNLAEANGGSLEHEAVDGGSVFRLSFPAAGA
jgi:signal transduction histidine kinase